MKRAITMASTLEDSTDHLPATVTEPAAVIDAAELDEARRDRRVRGFIAEADRYLAELERAGRNR